MRWRSKDLICTVLVASCLCLSVCQASSTQESLLTREQRFNIGKFPGALGTPPVTFEAVVIQAQTGAPQFSMRMTIVEATRYPAVHTVTVEFTKLPVLSEAIATLIDQARQTASMQVDYLNCRYGFAPTASVGFYQEGTVQTAYLSLGLTVDATLTTKVSRLAELKALVDKAMAKLAELGAGDMNG